MYVVLILCVFYRFCLKFMPHVFTQNGNFSRFFIIILSIHVLFYYYFLSADKEHRSMQRHLLMFMCMCVCVCAVLSIKKFYAPFSNADDLWEAIINFKANETGWKKMKLFNAFVYVSQLRKGFLRKSSSSQWKFQRDEKGVNLTKISKHIFLGMKSCKYIRKFYGRMSISIFIFIYTWKGNQMHSGQFYVTIWFFPFNTENVSLK